MFLQIASIRWIAAVNTDHSLVFQVRLAKGVLATHKPLKVLNLFHMSPDFHALYVGGIHHAAFPSMQAVAEKAGFKLVPGKGNDPDTLGKQVVFVYDTQKFPFHQAEVYHQFHNDFQSPPYGKAYNEIANQAFEDGRIKITGCPDRI